MVGFLLAIDPLRRIAKRVVGAELIPVLGRTARVQLVVGLLFAFGLLAS